MLIRVREVLQGCKKQSGRQAKEGASHIKNSAAALSICNFLVCEPTQAPETLVLGQFPI